MAYETLASGIETVDDLLRLPSGGVPGEEEAALEGQQACLQLADIAAGHQVESELECSIVQIVVLEEAPFESQSIFEVPASR